MDMNLLCNDYSNTIITRDTIIHFKCTNCNIETTKNLRQITISGSYCKKCTEYNRQKKVIQSNLKNYGVENVFQSEEIKDKIKETNLERYGDTCALRNPIIKEKSKQTCFDTYGVEFPLQNNEILLKLQTTNLKRYGNICSAQNLTIKEKIKETNLKRYGVEHSWQNQEIMNKVKNTIMEKYGCEYATQSELIQNKTKETNLQRYGVEHPWQNQEIMNKVKNTIMERYGYEYATQSKLIQNKTKETNLKKYGGHSPMCSKDIQEKSKQTSLQNYGVEHPMQNTNYAYNICNNSFKLKDYILPSGNVIKIQGYEHYALYELLQIENTDETDIITGCANVPDIWYEDENNKQHRHYVDIFIPTQNRMIEVKSTWTAEKKKDCIFLKQKAAKKTGYLYEIWVYNNKGEKVECYK
jgi:hypothetical protein